MYFCFRSWNSMTSIRWYTYIYVLAYVEQHSLVTAWTTGFGQEEANVVLASWQWSQLGENFGCSNFTSYGSHKDHFITISTFGGWNLHYNSLLEVYIKQNMFGMHPPLEDDTYYVDPVLQNHSPLSPGSSSSPGTWRHGLWCCFFWLKRWIVCNPKLLFLQLSVFRFLVLRNLLKDIVPGTDIVSLVRTLLQGEPSVWNVTS